MRRKINKLALNVVSAVVSSFVTLSANATAYSFKALGALGDGTGWSRATAINNVGQVVGVSQFNDGSQHATLWNGAIAIELAPLTGSFSTIAYAINNSGQVAGVSSGHAILWNGTTATDLGTLSGAHSSIATAINDSGEVGGWSTTAGNPYFANATLWNGTTATDLGQGGSVRGINNAGQVVGSGSRDHATLWNGTTVTDLGTLGGIRSEAYDINNAGQVVGWSYSQSGVVEDMYISWVPHATIWNGTTAIDLGSLGGANDTKAGARNYSYAFAMNDVGLIVGRSEGSFSYQHATLWDNGTIIDLNSLLDASNVSAGWVLDEATGINENGWIVGKATNTLLGVSHAFILSPVPEPETYTMLISGLSMLGFVLRRRKNK